MKKFVFVLILTLVSASAFAQVPSAAGKIDIATPTSGTLTVTYRDFPGLRVLTLTCVSDASGNVTAPLPMLRGKILRVVTNPDGATAAPSDDYDVTLLDEDGADLLTGKGANRDEATTEQFVPVVGNGTGAHGLTSPGGTGLVSMGGTSTLAITGMGDANGAVVRIYLER